MELELNDTDISRLFEQSNPACGATETYPEIETSSHYDTAVFFRIHGYDEPGRNKEGREFSVATGKLKDVLKSTLRAGITLGIEIGKERARTEIKKTLGLPTNFEIKNKS